MSLHRRNQAQYFVFVALVALMGGCGGGAAKPKADGGATGGGGGNGTGGMGAVGGNNPDGGSGTGFSVLVAQAPPGPTIAMALWQGVLRYTLTGDGAPIVPSTGIDKAVVSDPVGLAFRAASSEVFIGNRHGNNGGDGVTGSISRFVYDKGTGTFTPNGRITGNGLSSVCQLAFNPVNGELFAANFGTWPENPAVGGISRFTFDSSGNAVANGKLGDGPGRGVAVSPDGGRLYYTVASKAIRQFDLTTGTELTPVTINAPETFRLHLIGLRGNNELYVAAVDNNLIYRFGIDASNDLTAKGSVTGDTPVSVAFSPDGLEMFTAGHVTSDVISRFAYDAPSDTWSPGTRVTTTTSLGGLLVLP